MSRATSDLPFGSEFSPTQVDLSELLQMAAANTGGAAGLQQAILDRYFATHGGSGASAGKNRKTLAMNCRLGMKAYGIIDDEAHLTPFGKSLADLVGDEAALYDAFARHILVNLNGLALVRTIQDMFGAGETVNLDTLRQALLDRAALRFPRGGKHPSMMRLWLAKAGVFVGSRWQVDELRVRALIGVDSEDYAQLARFTPEQRAFLLALCNSGITEPQPANEVAKLASATFGVRFPDKSLPKAVLNDLVEAGYITATKTTEGRGAKPFLVSPTAKLTSEVVQPLLDRMGEQVDSKLLDILNRPLTEIISEIGSEDRYVAGLALEALALKLMRILGVDYVATRLRASSTGGAEVDLVFQSTRLVFSRWQVQCKNTGYVSLDDVAKEVGLTHFLKSNAIVVVSTGQISADARRYSNKVMRDSNLAIVLLDRPDLEAIMRNPAAIVDAFQREAGHAMQLKQLDI